MAKIKFKIGDKKIQENGDVFIIAEAGVNHNGRLDLALKLVDLAADVGADAVKFQTFQAEEVVIPSGEMAAYQIKNIGMKKTQLEMLRQLSLPSTFYRSIIDRCKKRHIIFLSTPQGGRPSVDFLEKLNIPAYKIDSGNLTNYLLLDYIAKLKKPIILSTGMATIPEIKEAVYFIESRRNKKIAILHCTTDYPCKITDVNFQVMLHMMKQYFYPIGYSDHSLDNQVAIMAATLGAAIYEFHITLDKTLQGPDHQASADPSDASIRISSIRKTGKIMGSLIKPAQSELRYISKVRRSLVYTSNLKSGQILTDGNIEGKRPADGVPAKDFLKYVGKKLKRDVVVNQQLSKADFT